MSKTKLLDRCDSRDIRDRDIRDIGLLGFLEAFKDVEDSDAAAVEFLTGPRSYLAKRGLLVPVDTRVTTIPTEEYRAALLTADGVDRFIARQRSETAKIKLHVKTGLAKCARIEFECPKKDKEDTEDDEPETQNLAARASGD